MPQPTYIYFLNHALPSNSPPPHPWPLSGIHLPLTLKRWLHQLDMRKLWHCRQLIRVKWRLDLDRFPASLARGRVRASESGTPIRLDPTKKTTKTMTRLWEKVALNSRCNPLQCLVDIDTASLAKFWYYWYCKFCLVAHPVRFLYFYIFIVFVLTLLWFLGSEPACTISLHSAMLSQS